MFIVKCSMCGREKEINNWKDRQIIIDAYSNDYDVHDVSIDFECECGNKITIAG